MIKSACVRRSLSVFARTLLALVASCLLGGNALHAEPRQAQPSPGAASRSVVVPAGTEVFPAAANIRPGPEFIGPIDYATGITLTPNDLIGYDPVFNGNGTDGGAILDFSVHGGITTGAETSLASSTVGSGVAYAENVDGGGSYVAPAPSGMIYYFKLHAASSTIADLVQLNPSTLVRTVVSDGTNTTLGPSPSSNIFTFAWDFATGTVVYYDETTGGNTVAASGFYRVDPTTGKRTAVSLTGGNPGSGIAMTDPMYAATDAFGNIFYIDSTSTSNQAPVDVVEIPVTGNGNATYGARAYVSNNSVGSQSGGTYYDLDGLWVDASQNQTLSNGLPTAESIIISDAGTGQTTSAIFRVPSNNGAKTKLISYNSTNANNGSAVFDYPGSAVSDTTGRVYYQELHTNITVLTIIPAGTHAAASVTNAPNLDSSLPFDMAPVPPPAPTLAAPTASSVLGTTATLNGNVTADGGVTNSGIITRGFVYALTSANTAPRMGGAGVTQISNSQATSVPVAQGSNGGTFSNNLTGLAQSTSYSFSAYAQNVSGITYSAPVTFTTTAPPSVTTNGATSITGTGAALNGNVTSDGGSSVTARGFVYSSTNTMPILNASGTVNIADGTLATGTYTDSTVGTLSNGTTYYFRAYASNQVGTVYGSILTFTTVSAPTANSQSVNVPFNTAVAVTLTGSDPNNPVQTITYNVTAQPSHGTLSGTAPNETYTPAVGYHGADTFQFTTTNTSGLTSSAATVTLTVATGTPTAIAQSVNVAFNTATAVTLTGTDPDSPALTLTYSTVTSPTHGTLSGTAPNLTYTPTANYQGTDSFTFRVSNGTTTSNNATVTLTVAAGTPTANAQSVNVAFNTATAVTLTGTDPDSPALALTYNVTTQPAHGTLSGTAPNLSYTPTANYQGADSFTFRVSNGANTSNNATVTLTVAAGTPTANAQSVNVNLNQARSITLTGMDPDSPALALSYNVTSQPVNGTLSGTAPNLTYTPNTGYASSDSFTFTVSNGQKTSTAATVSLTVIGEPTVSSFTPASGPVGTLVTITGTNLQNTTGVSFFRNAVATTFTVIGPTQVSAVVPAGAKTGILTVISGSGSNNASTKFIVTP